MADDAKDQDKLGRRDDNYKLDGFIEMDEGFFEGHRKKDEDMPEGKSANDLDRQVKVIVSVSIQPLADDDKKKAPSGNESRFFKNERGK